MTENTTQQPRYVQIPELIELFKNAPAFVASKAYKAIPLSENGELMVETQITEHMAAGLATIAQEVQAGEYALIQQDLTDKILPYLDDDGAISPLALLDNHIEVMDVSTKDNLLDTAIIDGELGTVEANIYPDVLLHAIIAPEDMNIPSFMDPLGVEKIHAGQLLVRSGVLGVYPYERPHHSLTADATFLETHLPVSGAGVITSLESSAPHQALAKTLKITANAAPFANTHQQGSAS